MSSKTKRVKVSEEEEEDIAPASEDSDLDAIDLSEHEDEGPELNQKDFTQRSVYNAELLDKLTKTMKDDFYNRLHSKKLIKRQGKVPFVEHMTVVNDSIVALPENAAVHNDLKRELCFYNLTLQDTKNAIEMLMQSNVKIGRPDDFFAEMMKTDVHMRKIKSKVLKQEEKIKQFEEKKLRLDNKKFRKCLSPHFNRQKNQGFQAGNQEQGEA
jgi:rRNA-processing protein EBP2